MRTTRDRHRAGAFLVFACATLAGVAVDAGQIQIRARARVEVTPRLAAGGGLAVSGRLADDRGRPISAEVVQVGVVDCVDHTAQTGQDGTFVVQFPRSELDGCGGNSFRLASFFGGSSRYGPATWERDIDPRRAIVDLVLAVRPEAVEAGARVHIEADLRVDAEPLADAAVDFEIGGRPLEEAPRTRTDARGRAVLEWTPTRGEYRGTVTVGARFAGSSRLNGASDERALRVFERPVLGFEARVDGADLVAVGRLNTLGPPRESTGPAAAPVPGEVVTIVVNGSAVHSSVTDADGGFDFVAPMRTVTDQRPGQRVWVAARYDPSSPLFGSARTEEVPLVVPVPQTIPLPRYLWILLAAAGLLLVLGPGMAGFRRTAAALRAALRPRRGAPALAGSGPLVLAPSRVGGGGPQWSVRVRLWDEDARRPLPGAPARVRFPDGAEAEILSDDDGVVAFTAGTLGTQEPGTVRLDVDLGRFEPVSATLTVPHDGRFDDATIRLVTCRLAALGDYRRYIDRRVPGGAAWGRRTPRQTIPTLAGSGAASPAGRGGRARAVVLGFEALYYGAPTLPRRALEDLRRAIAPVGGDEEAP